MGRACGLGRRGRSRRLPPLHATMVSVVTNSGTERQLALLRAHPELAHPGPLTAASSAEQGGMGLDRLAADEAAAFDKLNVAYRTRFGFPFIIAVRGQRDRAAILAALSARLQHSPEQELRGRAGRSRENRAISFGRSDHAAIQWKLKPEPAA